MGKKRCTKFKKCVAGDSKAPRKFDDEVQLAAACDGTPLSELSADEQADFFKDFNINSLCRIGGDFPDTFSLSEEDAYEFTLLINDSEDDRADNIADCVERNEEIAFGDCVVRSDGDGFATTPSAATSPSPTTSTD